MDQPTVLSGRAPRHHIDPFSSVDVSEGVREFREVSELRRGMVIPFPGLADMRCGKRAAPQVLVIRFLAWAHRNHLPRSWGERFVVFCQSQVDRTWAQEVPDLRSARRSAVLAENAENCAEMEGQAPHPDAGAELYALQVESAAVRTEIAADRVRLTALEKRIRQLESAGVTVG